MRPSVTRLGLIGLLIGALALGYFMVVNSRIGELIENRELLLAAARQLGALGPLLIVGLMIVAIVFNPLPSAPIALAAGALYGHTLGTLYVVLGAELGAILAFLIARTAGYDLIRRYIGETNKFVRLGSQNSMTLVVFVSRLIPFMSFDLISYGAGLTPLKLWRFAAATLLGLLPMSFALAHFGSEIATGEGEGYARLALWLGLLVAIPLLLGYLIGRPAGMRRSSGPVENSTATTKPGAADDDCG